MAKGKSRLDYARGSRSPIPAEKPAAASGTKGARAAGDAAGGPVGMPVVPGAAGEKLKRLSKSAKKSKS